MLAALVDLPLCLRFWPVLIDLSSSIRGQGKWPLYCGASTWVSGKVHLAVCFFIYSDAGVSQDTVNFGWEAVGEKSICYGINPPRKSLPLAGLMVCHLSNCSLLVAEDCHHLHSVLMLSFSSIDHLPERESIRPQLGINDIHTSTTQITAAGSLFITEHVHCCCCHLAVVRALMFTVVPRVRAAWLLQLIGRGGESFWEAWISFCNWCNCFTSLEACKQVMNVALRVDMAIRVCFRDCQEIAPLLVRNTWPPWDLQFALSLAQSESNYHTRVLLMSMPMPMPMPMPLQLKCSQKLAVDMSLWRTLLAPVIWLVNGLKL